MLLHSGCPRGLRGLDAAVNKGCHVRGRLDMLQQRTEYESRCAFASMIFRADKVAGDWMRARESCHLPIRVCCCIEFAADSQLV